MSKLFLFFFMFLFQAYNAYADLHKVSYQWGICTCEFDPDCVIRPTEPKWSLRGLWEFIQVPKSDFCWMYSVHPHVEVWPQSLKDAMDLDWKDVVSGNNENFWRDEFAEHGRCYGFPFRQLDYYRIAMRAFYMVNVTEIMLPFRTSPISDPAIRNFYPLSQIASAFAAHGVPSDSVEFSCIQGIRNDDRWLHEVRILYDDGGRLMSPQNWQMTPYPPNDRLLCGDNGQLGSINDRVLIPTP